MPSSGPPSASPSTAKRVCVIGAGACGLIAAKTFAAHGHSPTILEQTNHTSGTWRYSPTPSPASAMYDQLITNLPHDIMRTSDLAFPAGTAVYPHRQIVHDYLVEYERVNGLRRLIRFESTVRRVEASSSAGGGTGGGFEVYYSRPAALPPPEDAAVVESKEDGDAMEYVQQFDAVCVCSGHFSVPFYPPIPGLIPPKSAPPLESLSPSHPSRTGPPLIMHSVHYRTAGSFVGLTVLVLGSGHSGTDIAGELCDTARRVYISSRKPLHDDSIHQWVVARLRKAGKHVCVDSDRYERLGALRSVNADGTVTVAGSDGQPHQLPVDVVLLATGFEYSFPFLDASSSISLSTSELHVSPLYGALFHPDHRGLLSFPALQWSIVPFPYCEVQAEWAARILAHTCTLPDTQKMRQAAALEERVKEAQGKRGRFYMQCDSMVAYVRWVVAQMRQCGCDERFSYEFVIDEERRVRRQPRPLGEATAKVHKSAAAVSGGIATSGADGAVQDDPTCATTE